MATILTNEAYKAEIERLKASENVKLARKEQRLKYKQRQFLYTLRNLEKRGKALAAQGYTLDNLEAMIAQAEAETGALEMEEA
ncbi:MAG: hypothetical protein J6V25_01950 [Oscillospiraceae bacterium]|nr:hypothetical protein [Oscillospiraceae bacterium]